MKIFIKYVFILLGLGLTSSVYAGAGISRFVSLPELQSASVGFCIIDVESGKVVSSHDARRTLLPASVLKLLTSATALEMYGGEHRFYTDVSYSGTIKDGVLYGNLYIRGCGDPTLGSVYGKRPVYDFRESLLKKLKDAGISRIEGCIVADDSRFDTEGVSPKWLWEDLGNYFAAGCYGVNYRDNTYRLTLRSGIAGTTPSIVRVDPEVPGLHFTNYLVASRNPIDSAYIYGAPFSLQRYIYGTIPEKRNAFVIKGDFPDPALFLADEMTSFLKASRISVKGAPVTMRMLVENGKDTEHSGKQYSLFRYPSDRLSDIIRIVNHNSNNLYAESLLRWIALTRYPKASAIKGVEVLKHFWREKGVDLDKLIQYDGNGLSPVNRISAEMICRILASVASDKNLQPIFYASLPRPGTSGTVRSFLKNSPLSKQMWLKSGSMAYVQSYAGYYNSGNRRYAIAVIVNNFDGPRARLRQALEQMFEAELKSL